MATPASDLKRLGRYDIESVLGKGAMGIVYSGIDSRLQRRVAIKTILKSALDEDTAKEYSMRFDREARAVARLNHPNIVQVYDFGEEGDIAYIVMEFIKGRELKAFFDAKERFDAKETVHIMGELCEALNFAHEQGVIHRDIKPANVMIDAQGRVKLADFGVARITDADRGSNEKTQAGAVVGTPAYMSPEQIEGGNIDRRTDIFSAGIILYQFLTGEKPFTGEGAWTVAKKILQDDPPRPSSINKTITPLFDSVVNKALAKNADQRFQTARDLGVALKKALEGQSFEDDEKTIVGSLSGVADDEKTIVGSPPPSLARAAAAPAETSAARATQATATQEMDLEFWRAIKDGEDASDFELYIEQFPNGIYTALAKRKIAKLRGQASEDSTTRATQAAEAEKREIEEAARKEAEAKAKLAEEKEKLEKELAEREAEMQRRVAEAEAKREAEAKDRAEAEAKAKAEFEAKLALREKEMQEREAVAKKREEEAAYRQEEAKKREEEAKQRQEEAKKREAEAVRMEKEVAKKKRGPVIAIGIAVVVAIAFIAYIVLKPPPTITAEELVKMLEEAKKANAELLDAKKREQEMIAELERTRQAEAEAKAAGDVEKQRQLAELAKQREAELQKQAELVKKREAEAQRQADLAKQRQEQLEKQLKDRQTADKTGAEKVKAEAERAAAEKAAAERAASERAVERAAADKAAATQRAVVDKAAAERAATERAAADKAAAERAAVERAAADRAAAERAATEKIAAEKAAAEKAAAAKAAAERVAIEKGTGAAALAAKAIEQAAKGEKIATLDVAQTLLKQGESAESNGDVRAAVRFYRDAARNGSGQAAKLLGDIYSNGKGDVGRDYQESLRWYGLAKRAGIAVPEAVRR